MIYNKIPSIGLSVILFEKDNRKFLTLTITNEFGKVSKTYSDSYRYMYEKLAPFESDPQGLIESGLVRHHDRYPTTTVVVCGDDVELPLPPRKADALFVGSVPTETSFCDKQGSRDCGIIGYIYCRNNVYLFTGQDMPGKVMVTSSVYTKNGKWSNTSYELLLAPGYKFASKRADFSSGEYIDNLKSLRTVATDLSLEEVTDEAIARFMYCNLPTYWVKYCNFAEKRDAIFEATNCDSMMDFDYHYSDGTKRQGFKYLLIDGEVWHRHMNPMPEKVIFHDFARGVYNLKIASNCEVEELYEWNYGEDSMESRGYVRVENELGHDPYMVSKNNKTTSGNNPFADLLSRFK